MGQFDLTHYQATGMQTHHRHPGSLGSAGDLRLANQAITT